MTAKVANHLTVVRQAVLPMNDEILWRPVYRWPDAIGHLRTPFRDPTKLGPASFRGEWHINRKIVLSLRCASSHCKARDIGVAWEKVGTRRGER